MSSFSCPVVLLSAPGRTGSTAGTLTVTSTTWVWTTADEKAPISSQFQDSRLQKSPDAKPDVKLRILYDGATYVFDFLVGGVDSAAARSLRERFIELHRVVAGSSSRMSASAAAVGLDVHASSNVSAALARNTPAIQRGRVLGDASLSSNVKGESKSPQPVCAGSSAANTFHGLAGYDLSELRRAALASRPALAAQWRDLVGGGVIADDEFWRLHKDTLLDVALARPKVGMPSQQPLGLLGAGEVSQGVRRVAVDKAAMLQIFARQPALRVAYATFVPLSITQKDFWTAYFRAEEFRRARAIADAAAAGLGTKSAPASRPPRSRQLDDVQRMQHADFFEAFRRGEFDLLAVTGISSRRDPTTGTDPLGTSRAAVSGLDPRLDLLATAEDEGRNATSGRAGRRTADSSRDDIPAVGPEWATDPRASAERAAADSLRNNDVVESVNSYSSQVVAAAGSQAGGLPSQETGREDNAVGASSLDDLVDLHAEPAPDAYFAPLKAGSVSQLREAIVAQGMSEGTPRDEAGLRPVGTVAVALGLGGAGSLETRDASVFHDKGSAISALSAGVKRMRNDVPKVLDTLHVATEVQIDARVASQHTSTAAPQPSLSASDTASAFAQPSIRAARRVIRAHTQASHTLFGVTDRWQSGFSRALPPEWCTFVEQRFKLNREVMTHLWGAMVPTAGRQRGVVGATSGSSDAFNSAARRDKLRARLSAEYDALESTKQRALLVGAHGLVPPPADGPPRVAADVGVAVKVTDEAVTRAATSELVSLLNMMQSSLRMSVERADALAATDAAC